MLAGELLLDTATHPFQLIHCHPEVPLQRLPLPLLLPLQLSLLGLQQFIEGYLFGLGEGTDGVGDAQSLDKSLNIGFYLTDAGLFLTFESLNPHYPWCLFSLLLHQSPCDLLRLRRGEVGISQDEVVTATTLLPSGGVRFRRTVLLGGFCGFRLWFIGRREGRMEGAGGSVVGAMGDFDGGVGRVGGGVVVEVVHVVGGVASQGKPYFMGIQIDRLLLSSSNYANCPHMVAPLIHKSPRYKGYRGYGTAGWLFQLSLQQMFDFLNKLSHHHASPSPPEPILFEQLSSEEDDPQLHPSASQEASFTQQHQHSSPQKHQTIERSPPRPPKPIKRGDSIVGKMQVTEKLHLSPAATSILEGALALSELGLGTFLKQQVLLRKQERQRKVFIREMAHDEEEYLHEAGRAAQVQSSFLKQGLHSTLTDIVEQISREIEIADLPIRMRGKKADPEAERKQEMLRLIKLRESQLQDKIGELSVEFQLDEHAEHRALEMLNKDEFDPDSVKTKMAEEFVREKQREREEKKQRLEQFREKRKVLESQVRQEQQQRQQQLRLAKHQRLIREFADKQKAKQEQSEKAKTEELNYKQFLKDYKQLKPLYQKREEEYQTRLKEEKRERYHALKDKQAQYEPLNMEMLEMHEERYEELRREDRERKEAEMELAKQKEYLLKKQLDEKIYKGKFRYLVLQEMVDSEAKKREKEAQRQAILAKKQAYSLEVKQHFKPTVDPAKRHEMLQILNSQKQRHRKFATPNRVAYSEHYSTISSRNQHPFSEPEADPRKEGEKYHRLFKQYIRGKIQKGEVRSEEEPEEKAPFRHPDYLKELREKYEGRIPSKSTRLDRQIEKLKEGEDFRALMVKAEEFEGKAKQREMKLKHSSHTPAEEAQLQEDYLCAIKAKMQLINNMD